jgi:hypothetical protein
VNFATSPVIIGLSKVGTPSALYSTTTQYTQTKGNHMLYEYDDGHASFECYLLAEHIEDDSRSYVELLPEYVERGERSKYWINNEYLSEGE